MQMIYDVSGSGLHDSRGFLRRSWAAVNLDLLDHNIQAIRRRIPQTCDLMGVVKADAYGHGDVMVAKRLVQNGAAWLGVSNIDEAMALRRKGIGQETGILIFGDTPVCYATELAQYGITQTVYSTAYAHALSNEAARIGALVDVHCKVDTGMGRIGFVCGDGQLTTAEELTAVTALPALNATGIFTHFSCADDPDPDAVEYTHAQFARFMHLCDTLAARGITFRHRHCCNSGGLLNYPEMHLDMVRAGIILYGLAPSPSLVGEGGFVPVLELKTVISQVKTVPAGSFISYGRTYQTPSPRTLAAVCIGYADGYLRTFSGRANMLVHGQLAPVVGRVCMDQLMLDITDIPDAKAGDVVTVFGAKGITADDLAALGDSIGYELVCLISRRVPHVYLQNGEEIAVADYIRSK